MAWVEEVEGSCGEDCLTCGQLGPGLTGGGSGNKKPFRTVRRLPLKQRQRLFSLCDSVASLFPGEGP